MLDLAAITGTHVEMELLSAARLRRARAVRLRVYAQNNGVLYILGH